MLINIKNVLLINECCKARGNQILRKRKTKHHVYKCRDVLLNYNNGK